MMFSIYSKKTKHCLLLIGVVVAAVLLYHNFRREILPPDERLPLQNIYKKDPSHLYGVVVEKFSNIKPIILDETAGPKKMLERKNWMIVRSKGNLTEKLKIFVKSSPDWIILLHDYPKNVDLTFNLHSFKNVILLDDKLRSDVTEIFKLSKNKWSDENLAYLYAIKRKAKIIVNTDVNVPDVERFTLDPRFTGLIPILREKFFNPLPHFGQSCAVLNGFPFLKHQMITTDMHRKYFLKTIKTPAVQYGIRSESNDIVFQPGDRFSSTASHPRSIDTIAPSVVKPDLSFTPFHPTVYLTHHSAFWTLLIPQLLKKYEKTNMAMVIRSFIQQKLMAHEKNSVMFVGLGRTDTGDMEFESKFDDYREFADVMANISCLAKNLSQCFLLIYEHLLRMNWISEDGFNIAKEWDKVLQKLLQFESPLSMEHHMFSNFTSKKVIVYYPKEQTSIVRNGIKVCVSENEKQSEINNELKMDLCNASYHTRKSSVTHFQDVLVIQIFNGMIGNSLKAVNLMYRHVFPNMLICADENTNQSIVDKFRLSFIPSYVVYNPLRHEHNTSMIFDCIALAMVMGYHVKGFFIAHDDLMLNYWHFQNKFYDKNKVWKIRDFGINDATTNKKVESTGTVLGNVSSWYHIQFRENTKNAMLAIHNSTQNSELWNCKVNIQRQFPRNTMYYYAQIDLFYWPQSMARDFAVSSQPFVENFVWPEIALPNIMNCVVPIDMQLVIPFGHDYSSRVRLIWQDYKSKLQKPYFHPFKMNSMFVNKTNGKRRVFCNEVMPEIAKH